MLDKKESVKIVPAEFNPSLFNREYYECGERGGFTTKGYTWEKIKPHANLKLAFIERQFGRFEFKTILFGCAAKGYEVRMAIEKGYEAYGIDISKYAIENVDPEVKDYCKQGDIRDLSQYRNNRFDIIACFDCIHTVNPKDRNKAYKEINRVAKLGLVFRTKLLSWDSKDAEFDGSYDGVTACREGFYTLINKVEELGKFELLYIQVDHRLVAWYAFVNKSVFVGKGRMKVVSPKYIKTKEVEVGDAKAKA